MSAPPRRPRGGGQSRGRGVTPTAQGGRGRGGMQSVKVGRGRGDANVSTNSKAETLLQGLQSGSLNQGTGALRRGSGRIPSHRQRELNSGHDGRSTQPPFTSSKPPPPSSQRDYMNHMTTKFQHLKTKREIERAKAIKDGFLADPEKKTSLDKAITPVGTCTEMCPEFERVERIVQNMVDKVEKVANEETGRDMPSEERMIKRFRRSAAGYDEQLPSDIRTPETLRVTLNYLLDNVVGGGERLATVHKFVWDRTRGIRNDFSIQQVTKEEDVRTAIDCFERIARFHILSLHQLSNPENLVGEHFDAHQEREQLNNTLLSLMYYYDDYRDRQDFANEAEFRAYCVIFELQSQQPDLEDRMQSWPQELLRHPRICTAFKLYSAAGNTLYDQGPLKPPAAFDIAQGNAVGFWNLLKSKAVTYLMACVAEIYFGQVRLMALQGLWKSIKRAPTSMQAKLQDWTLEELTKLMGFDDEEQSLEFCREYNLGFRYNDAGEQYLDFTSQPEMILDKSSTPNKQVFSFGIVEEKRYHRTLVAVINGINVAQAIREGLVVHPEEAEDEEAEEDPEVNDEDALFVRQTNEQEAKPNQDHRFLKLNQQAPAFTPRTSISQALSPPKTSSTPSISNGWDSQPATAPSSLSASANDPQRTGILENSPSLENPFKPQPTTSQLTPSNFIFSRAAITTSSSFGMPSFPANAPSPPAFSMAPSAVNSAWPSAVVNGIMNTNQPGNTPELVPAQAFDTQPLKDPPPIPLTEKTNIASPKADDRVSSFTKPPASPRPGYRSLPPITNAERTTPLFPELAQINTQAAMEIPTSESGRAVKFRPGSPPTPNSTTDLLPASNTQAPISFPRSANPSKSNSTTQDYSTFKTPQSSPFTSNVQTTKQPATSKPSNVPPITTNKSTIPSTFTPNASPSFTSPANTKPKHKSPLGSQPPIFATDSSAKRPAIQQPIANVDNAAENLATIGFLEPHGILQQYVEHTVTALVEEALHQFEREKPLRAAQSARQQLLSRKYFMRWKSICWRRILNRNATSRRSHLAKSIRRESQRKARGDAELEAILQAQRQKEVVQAEQQLRSQAGRVKDPVSEMRDGQRDPSLAGLKRKILHGDDLNPVTNGNNPRKVARGDTAKRSKGMERVSAPLRASLSSKAGTSPSPPHLNTAALPGRSLLLDRSNRTILCRSTGGHKVDSTHTDYFRLKALGVDPDTPIFPDTKSSLERRRRSQEELSHPTPRKRASTLSSVRVRTSGRDDSTSAINIQAPINITTPKTSLPVSKQIALEATSRLIDNDDDFLRQVREVRAAMSEDTEWFRTQAAQIEQEVEQEELRRSASQRSSTHSDGAAASGPHRGLSRVNGYDYAPCIPQSDTQLLLSRTEQRIRATGAHGLATKPVSDYLPVAMSKSTRAALTNGKVPGQAKKRKGKIKHSEKGSKYIYESDNHVEEDELGTERDVLARKRVRQNHQKRLARASSDAFEASKGRVIIDAENGDGAAAIANADADQHKALGFDEDSYDEEDEEKGLGEEELVEKEEVVIGVVEDEEGCSQPTKNGIDEGDEGEDEAEEYGEEDDGSVVSENLSEAGESTTSSNLNSSPGEQPGRKANPFHMRLRSATPESYTNPDQVFTPGGTQTSRATSGTGVSADDALVLSD
ncbi:hypothetical protein GJ744_001679 [Endocarpon pusillum]|uniref:SAC3/GANP/THP3 conserved domain-containing protein n=1 Tax=Endocarpon pusillum TaxID=364733 RepID=A0A8H7A951_9EURO|nr:hypothetical protein GJ744_001679 [Endocarpon pusillum]